MTPTYLKTSILILISLVTVLAVWFWIGAFHSHADSPAEKKIVNVKAMSVKEPADLGETLIFGRVGDSKVQGAIGKGQCPLCHGFQKNFESERAPNLHGIPKRALERLKDPRYHIGKPDERDTVQKESFPGAGTATNAIEYIAESAVCPSCYVVAGFGLKGSQDRENPSEPLLGPIIDLSIDDLIAIDTWLYVHSGEIPPSPDEIEKAYKKFIPESDWERMMVRRTTPPPPVGFLASGNEPIFEIFRRAGCLWCHFIPGIGGIEHRDTLTMRTLAPQRIKDPSYKGKATTVREYVQESILYPSEYVVPGTLGSMPAYYGQKLPRVAIDKMADYLSQLEEDKEPPQVR